MFEASSIFGIRNGDEIGLKPQEKSWNFLKTEVATKSWPWTPGTNGKVILLGILGGTWFFSFNSQSGAF
jgi:hypothetical protein